MTTFLFWVNRCAPKCLRLSSRSVNDSEWLLMLMIVLLEGIFNLLSRGECVEERKENTVFVFIISRQSFLKFFRFGFRQCFFSDLVAFDTFSILYLSMLCFCWIASVAKLRFLSVTIEASFNLGNCKTSKCGVHAFRFYAVRPFLYLVAQFASHIYCRSHIPQSPV